MSLKPSDARYIPEETARVAKAAFPKGNLAIFLRDELEGLYSDALFADLYPVKGKPADELGRYEQTLVEGTKIVPEWSVISESTQGI